MSEPVIIPPPAARPDPAAGVDARGSHIVIVEWGDDYVGDVAPLHVHHEDDEAWHVLSGRLRFRFGDREVIVDAGSTVLAPAGTPHTFGNPGPGPVRYLIVTSTRLNEMIADLHRVDRSEHAAIFRRYGSELLE
jgi:mannose-6-phosphate isomerase-like protein (cupin superfamily)